MVPLLALVQNGTIPDLQQVQQQVQQAQGETEYVDLSKVIGKGFSMGATGQSAAKEYPVKTKPGVTADTLSSCAAVIKATGVKPPAKSTVFCPVNDYWSETAKELGYGSVNEMTADVSKPGSPTRDVVVQIIQYHVTTAPEPLTEATAAKWPQSLPTMLPGQSLQIGREVDSKDGIETLEVELQTDTDDDPDILQYDLVIDGPGQAYQVHAVAEAALSKQVKAAYKALKKSRKGDEGEEEEEKEEKEEEGKKGKEEGGKKEEEEKGGKKEEEEEVGKEEEGGEEKKP